MKTQIALSALLALTISSTIAVARDPNLTTKPPQDSGFSPHKGTKDTSKDTSIRPPSSYLWAFHPGSGYVNGKHFKAAIQYCAANDAELASQDQLIHANDKGLSLCAYGWLSGGLAGFVMQGTHKGCGKDGWNSGGYPDTSRRYGAYCVGPSVPPDVPARYRISLSGS